MRPAQDAIVEAEETADTAGPVSRQADNGETAAKKRKVNNAALANNGAKASEDAEGLEVQVNDSQTLEFNRDVTPIAPVKRRKKRKSVGQQSMKAKPRKAQTAPKPAQKAPQKRATKSTPALPVEPSPEELRVQAQVHGLPFGGEKHPSAPEVTEARDFAAEAADPGPTMNEEVKGKRKKRKRVSIGQQSKKRAKPASPMPTKDIIPEGGIAVAEHMTDASQSHGEAAEDTADVANDAIEAQDEALEGSEPQTQQKGKRKKRKSIGQQRPKRKSTDLASTSTPARKSRPGVRASGLSETKKAAAAFNSGAVGGRHSTDEDVQVEVESISEAAEAPAVVPRFPKKRGRPSKGGAPLAPRPGKAPKAPRRHTKASNVESNQPVQTRSPQTREAPKNSIPITIYGPQSPTSSDPENSDVEDDPLSTAKALPPAKTINPVDVLSQICRELIHKTSASLGEKANEDASRRGEFWQRKRTVDMYGEELNLRLLQLTKTLNTNNALTVRLRDANRDAKRLKKDIKAIEEERERIRLATEGALKAKKAKELEDMLSKIAGAVKKGWEIHAETTRGDSAGIGIDEAGVET
ncbi:hypothetical protein P7C71_g4791, partial [Lecanoromycetidae sp. Uapishka_2]